MKLKIQSLKDLVLQIGVVVLFFVAWEIIVFVFDLPTYVIAPPSAIARVIIEKFDLLLYNAYVTTYEAVLGFFAGVTIGILLAIGIAYSKLVRTAIFPLVMAFNAIPKMTLAPIFVVWFGIGLISKVIMAMIITFFPVVVNTSTGLREIEPDMIDLARVNNASALQIFTKIRLPHSLPFMFDAFKICLPYALIGAIVGEFIGAMEGLGNLILVAFNIINLPLMFAAIAFVVIIAISMYAVVVFAERLLLKWRPSQRMR